MNLIAISGWPQTGKTEVAKILVEKFGAYIVDDGLVLRNAVPFLFHGVDHADMFTQEGKQKTYVVQGKTYTYRQLLGLTGQALEDMFGEFYVAEQALKRIPDLPSARFYVLPSVRKNQPRFYREHGALTLEINRAGVEPSENAFDRWDRDAIDARIHNNGTLEDLYDMVRATLGLFAGRFVSA